jgi:hypothetical protein
MSPQQMQRVAVTGAVVVALVAVCISALIVNFFAGLTFFGEPLHRGDFVHQMLASGLATMLILASMPAARDLHLPHAVVISARVLAVFGALDVLVSWMNWVHAPAGGIGEPWWWAPQFFFELPTTWPIVAMVLATPWIRGWWSPTRPAPLGR